MENTSKGVAQALAHPNRDAATGPGGPALPGAISLVAGSWECPDTLEKGGVVRL